jgi:hypothetical protein
MTVKGTLYWKPYFWKPKKGPKVRKNLGNYLEMWLCVNYYTRLIHEYEA